MQRCLAWFVLGAAGCMAALIPEPKSVRLTGSDVPLGESTRIVIPKGAGQDVRLAAEAAVRALGETAGLKPAIVEKGGGKGNIVLVTGIKDPELGDEGYRLQTAGGVRIEAADGSGLFYGVQTLRQLLRKQNGARVTGAIIRDWPSWRYRGVQLDPARNYMTMEFLKLQMDVISSYKLNYFHLHLTDHQGWRIEIKAHPNLVSEKHYTQEQLKELVAYAKARFLTLMPELEMPGHTGAFIEKMPDLGHNKTLCLGNPQLYPVLEAVWKETAAIFDSPYLHLGGDETKDFLECPRCKAKWDEARSAPDPPGSLIAWFLARMNTYIKSLGRQAVAWSVDSRHWGGRLPKDMVVMTWTSGAVEHAEQGYPTINTFVKPLYFDHIHPIQAFLEWSPDLGTGKKLPTLMGAEGQAWHDPRVEHEQQILENLGFYPRLMAMAERVWGPRYAPKPTDLKEFEARLLDHKARFFEGATFPYPPKVRDASRPYRW